MANPSNHIATVALADGSEIRVTLQATKGGGVDVRCYRRFTAAQVNMPTASAITVPLDAVSDVVLAIEKALALAVERGGVGA